MFCSLVCNLEIFIPVTLKRLTEDYFSGQKMILLKPDLGLSLFGGKRRQSCSLLTIETAIRFF